MGFTEYSAYKKLQKLAEKPFDLSKEGALTPERVSSNCSEALGMKLLYGTERIDGDVTEQLFALAEEAKVWDKMQAIQSGEMMNTIHGFESEDRMVLHTAMRDFFENKMEGNAAADAAKEAWVEVEKLKKFIEMVDSKKMFKEVVQIGIGGSDLGPKAIYLSLEAYAHGRRSVHFISNVDPDDVAHVIKDIDMKETLVVVVSKSGSTLETLTNEQFFRDKFKEAGVDPKEHIVAVTGKGSPMDNPEKYRESFYMWDYVGGRYSVTSMVGCVTLGLSLGMDHVMEFLQGASHMDKIAMERDPHINLPLMSALLGVWNRNFLELPTHAVIPYSNAMLRLPAHLQQCDMESNGKQITKDGKHVDFDTGPIIWGEPGTNGQHSFYQLIHQGTTVVPVEFIGFKENQYGVDVDVQGTMSQEKLLSNLFAQSVGLATGKHSDNPNKNFPGNRPNRLLLCGKCDPYTVGKILSYFENKVAFQGFIWGINSFDQEGVQLGKVLANQFIDLFAKKRKGETLSADDFALGQAYLDQLDDPGLYGDHTAPLDSAGNW